MLTLTQTKECLRELDRFGFESLIEQFGEDVIEAALECDVAVSDIEEAYQGEWQNDEDFAYDLIDSIYGKEVLDSPVRIDWGGTAEDIMMDYCEHNGYYFRIL